jgi:hypothetical protein
MVWADAVQHMDGLHVADVRTTGTYHIKATADMLGSHGDQVDRLMLPRDTSAGYVSSSFATVAGAELHTIILSPRPMAIHVPGLQAFPCQSGATICSLAVTWLVRHCVRGWACAWVSACY